MSNATNKHSATAEEQRVDKTTWSVLTWGTLAIWILGIWIRARELSQQPILGDEMHAVKSATGGTVASILAEKGLPDVSIPLALWDYLLLQTIGLSEWGLRLPVFVAGILFLPLLARLVQRHMGSNCALAAMGLAAASPLLILYSRLARPYMLIVLLSLIALINWLRHIEGIRHALAWACLATLISAALTPICLPALGSMGATAILLCYLGDRRKGRPVKLRAILEGKRWRKVVAAILAGAGLALCMRQTMLFVSLIWDLVQSVQERGHPIRWDGVGFHIVGTTQYGVMHVVAGLVVLGGVIHWIRASRLALLITVMTATQVLVITFLVPWGDRPFSIVRYLMVILPGLLCFAAAGLDGCAGLIAGVLPSGRVRNLSRLGLISVAVVLFIGQGPIPEVFRSHNSFTGIWPTEVPLPPAYGNEERPAWPHFYNTLMEYDGDVAIMESPTISTNRVGVMQFASYQRVHRRRVLVMNRSGPFRHPNLRLSSATTGGNEGQVQLGDAGILVLHKDFVGERKYIHQLSIGLPTLDERGESRRRAADTPSNERGDAQLLDRSNYVLDRCLSDESLTTIYEDKWVRAFSRDPQIIADFNTGGAEE